MDLKKQKSTFGIIVAFVIIVGIFSGCTSNNNQNNAAVSYPVLSAVDVNILNSAYETYETLKQSGSITEARLGLLETLSNQEGVEKAELGLDNYTIFITYSDGDFAAVDTYEPDETSTSPGISFGFYNEGSNHYSGYNKEISFDTFAGSSKKVTPGSKKVLILGPCYYDFDTEPFEESVDYFKDHGWTDDEIVMKVVDRTNWDTNYGNLKPDDFFDLSDYGIILYTGHGGTNIYNNFEEDNIYLQFCFITNDSYAVYPYLKTWQDEKKLLVLKEYTEYDGDKEIDWYSTALRADVLRTKLDTLPDSYMHLSTCFGAHFSNVFLDNGAKMFLGWSLKADGDVADANMLNLNKLMIANNCLYDAFMDDLVTRTGIWPDNYCDIYSNDDASVFYFPAWVDLTVSGIPSGTSYIKSSLYDSSSNLIGEVTDAVSTGATQINCVNLKDLLAPSTEEVTVEVKAFSSSGNELSSGEDTLTLDAGSNSLQIALAQSGELTIIFDNEDEIGLLDARRTTWPLSIEARFEDAPNGDVLYVWDASGAEGLGGFTYSMVQHYEQYDNDLSFYSTGSGTDGTKISISLSVYLVEGDGRQLLESASATIDVYNPTTLYSIVDQNDETRFMGSGSSWSFYNWGHGPISTSFYARSGDQLRIVCAYRPYYAEWEHYQVYLKQGETKTYLFSTDDIPEDGYSQTFTVP